MTAESTGVNRTEGIALRFWGVRGTLASPGPATLRYGGNTLCVELRCGPHIVVCDAGTGARPLGQKLAAASLPATTDFLLSHTHLDHIIGLPFFAPMFNPKARIRFWGGHLPPPDGIATALHRSWSAPLLPDLGQEFRAALEFHDFQPGTTLSLHPGLQVATHALHHPGGAVGFRISWSGASVCYITDTEHPPKGVDTELARFVKGTDILIHDASYTEAEYATRIGWGHATWRAATDLADAAGAKTLVLFHHEPNHDDDTMDEIAALAAARLPGTLVAKEGMRLTAPY